MCKLNKTNLFVYLKKLEFDNLFISMHNVVRLLNLVLNQHLCYQLT